MRPEIETLSASVLWSANNRPNLSAGTATVSSRGSSNVMVIFVPFTVAETNEGGVESEVLLVAVLAAKSGTGWFALSASWSLSPVSGAA